MRSGAALAIIGIAAIAAIVFLIIGAWWAAHAEVEILAALNTALVVTIGLSASFAVAGLLFYLWRGAHSAIHQRAEARQAMAQAKRAEREALFTFIKASGDEQVFIEGDVTWRAAHRDPRVYANSHWTEPNAIETAAYLAWLESMQPRIPERVTDALLDGPPMNLLTATMDIERALIVGGSGSGKTTLLQHMIAARRGEIVVIDPHDDTHTWPGHAQVVGAGQDYGSIERALVGLVGQVRERYKLRATGETLTGENCPALWVIIDEWRELTQNIKAAGDHMKVILTGGRKVHAGTIVGTHSERARPMGIEGEADLKDGFAVVRLKGNRQVGFSATLDTGDGESPIALPGPYHPALAAPTPAPAFLDVANVQLPMSEQERQILQLHKAGRSVSKIGAMVYGSRGGWQSDRVKEVLQKFSKL